MNSCCIAGGDTGRVYETRVEARMERVQTWCSTGCDQLPGHTAWLRKMGQVTGTSLKMYHDGHVYRWYDLSKIILAKCRGNVLRVKSW